MSSGTDSERVAHITERALAGNLAKGADKLAEQGKLFVRDRLALLLDDGSFVEDGLLANALADNLPADGVVTGVGRVDGRPVCVMANDTTVKAGSWARARSRRSCGSPSTRCVTRCRSSISSTPRARASPIRSSSSPVGRGAGRIFANQVRLSGRGPQVCCLFGPSAAGGAYIPTFCDVVFMVEGNASMYLGSPRMAEMVIGEHISPRGDGWRAHARDGQRLRRQPRARTTRTRSTPRAGSSRTFRARGKKCRNRLRRVSHRSRVASRSATIVPEEERRAYDMHRVIDALVDEESFFELKPLWAKELVIGFARIDGEAVGIVANNPMHLGGVLFVDSADKAARFIWLCDAFNVPLLFLADVPGFMIGSQVERQGIIRHGAKMITAVDARRRCRRSR